MGDRAVPFQARPAMPARFRSAPLRPCKFIPPTREAKRQPGGPLPPGSPGPSKAGTVPVRRLHGQLIISQPE
jgi:hypothetical protein